MSVRPVAGCLLLGLLAIPTLAGDRKKPPITPETQPAPLIPIEQIVAPPRVVPLPECGTSNWIPLPGFFEKLVLPSGHYLEKHPPQYFPDEPQLPLQRELVYQDEADGRVTPVSRSTKAGARETLKTYSVGDLVVPMPKIGAAPAELPKTLEANLIKGITSQVHPAAWRSAGGTGSIEYFPLGMALVVNAPPHIHAALDKYLDDLRRISDVQIMYDVRVMSVSDAGLQRSCFGADFRPAPGRDDIKSRVKFLSVEDVAGLNVLEWDPQITAAPRLVALNGQEGTMRIGQTQHFMTGITIQTVNGEVVVIPKNEPIEMGLEVKIQGTVSADQKYVRLAVNATSKELATSRVGTLSVAVPIPTTDPTQKRYSDQEIQNPKFATRTVKETVTAPDGGTVVFYGGKATTERVIREKLPMLADVPIVAELFARDRKEESTDHLLVFVTPRVVSPEVSAEACCEKCDGKLGKLLGEYNRACKEGKSDDARRLAIECLSLDPTCFGKK